jgi:acyl-CoA-binding protein
MMVGSFEEACELVRNRPETLNVTQSDKRMMYTYYKVATVGAQPNVPRPSSLSPKAPFWDAWNTHGTKLTAETAKALYVAMVAQKASE